MDTEITLDVASRQYHFKSPAGVLTYPTDRCWGRNGRVYVRGGDDVVRMFQGELPPWPEEETERSSRDSAGREDETVSARALRVRRETDKEQKQLAEGKSIDVRQTAMDVSPAVSGASDVVSAGVRSLLPQTPPNVISKPNPDAGKRTKPAPGPEPEPFEVPKQTNFPPANVQNSLSQKPPPEGESKEEKKKDGR